MAINPEINAPRRDSAPRQKANAFWRWWSGELVRLVPERFAMRRADRAPLLAVDANSAAIVAPRPGASEQRVDLAGLDEARRKAAVRGLLERAGETRLRARAVLGPQEALVRRVTMPAATEENLRQVLAFEMDRLTPFKADEVYFDYRVVSRDAAAGQVLLQVAVARRELVDARVAALRALAVNVQGVGLAEDSGHAGSAFDLLPSEQRGERDSPRERLVQRGLAIAVVVLLAVALGLPLVQKRAAWMAMNPEVESARQKAETTGVLSQELDRQVADYNFLLARKHGTYSGLAILEDVTRLLPDNTWVQQMDIRTVGKTREVQIVGETASASKLIEILEASTLLQNAAFRGTVTRGSQPNTERFMIAAEVRPRAQPEARPLLEMPAEPPAPRAPAPVAAPAAPPGPAGEGEAAPSGPSGSSAPAVVRPVPAPTPGVKPKSQAQQNGPTLSPSAPKGKYIVGPDGRVIVAPRPMPEQPAGGPQ